MRHYLILVALVSILNGCSSISNTVMHGAHPYIGTRFTVDYMTEPFENHTDLTASWFFTSLLLGVDFWLTLPMDTILLPFTAISNYRGCVDQ